MIEGHMVKMSDSEMAKWVMNYNPEGLMWMTWERGESETGE
jgi:hypothetical protein